MSEHNFLNNKDKLPQRSAKYEKEGNKSIRCTFSTFETPGREWPFEKNTYLY